MTNTPFVVVGLLFVGSLAGMGFMTASWSFGPGLKYAQHVEGYVEASCQAASFEAYASDLRDARRGIDELGINLDWTDSGWPNEQVYIHTVRAWANGLDALAQRADQAAAEFAKSQNQYGNINHDLYQDKLNVLVSDVCPAYRVEHVIRDAYQRNEYPAYFAWTTLSWMLILVLGLLTLLPRGLAYVVS